MSLHGSLETFALPDVLTLIASTRKTGELRVSGPKLEGSVWLSAGQVVETAVGKTSTFVDALFDLLRLRDGKFSFEGDRPAPHPGAPADIAPLLEETEQRLTQWREIEKVIPSLDHVLELISDVSGPVTLRHEQWPLIVALAANRTPRSVIEAVGASEFEGCKALKELADAHLVKVSAPAPAVKPPARSAEDGKPAGAGQPGDRSSVAVQARIEETPGVRVMETALPPVADGDPASSTTRPEPAMAEAVMRQLANSDGAPAGPNKGQKAPATTSAAPAKDSGGPAKQADGPAPSAVGSRLATPGEAARVTQGVSGPAAAANGRGPARPAPTGSSAPAQAGSGRNAPSGGAAPAASAGSAPGSAAAPAAAAEQARPNGASGPAGVPANGSRPVAAAGAAASAAKEAEPAEAPEAEEAPSPGEEPINRGLLLKFLSSVRS